MSHPAAYAQWAMEQESQDPLALYQHKNWALERWTRDCTRFDHYISAANSSGKTTGTAAGIVRMAQGMPELGGIALPRFNQPSVWGLLVESHQQATPSTIAAYKRAIGNWPHHYAYVQGGLDYVGVMYIKYQGCRSDDWKDWSRIIVYTHEGVIPQGGRLAGFHADEIPPARMWHEARMRAQRGQPFVLVITGTPTDRAKWDWLMQDDEYKLAQGHPKNGRVWYATRLEDNRALSAEDIRKAKERAKGDPHEEARLTGAHIDVAGSPAFKDHLRTLNLWRSRCRPGEKERIVVQEEASISGRTRSEIALDVEAWAPYDADDVYYLAADLGSGKRRPGIDPLGLHLWSRRRRALVVRYNGNVHPYGLGRLASVLCHRYGNALADFENNAGWGIPFLHGLREGGHTNINRDKDSEGRFSEDYGWNTNEESRQAIIGAVERSLSLDDCGIWSEDVVSCLANCIIDAKGKILAGPGRHDEDLILAGRALHMCSSRPAAPAPRAQPSTSLETFRQQLRGQFGRDVLRKPDAAIDAW